ncbi:hypothetical protein LCGC14_0364760 [marine sediment metagenome]|uniref:Uncharacterized protein n=1 Tax=marine sediment metagenome TaxID=412755 RepID=A0A0F9TCR3_9ZZZZ
MKLRENNTDYDEVIADAELNQIRKIMMSFKNTAVGKVATGSNLKWVGLIGLGLSFFIYTQTQARAQGKQEEKVATNSAVILQLIEANKNDAEVRIEQVAQIAKLEKSTEVIEKDVAEIKKDNKEMIKLLIEINNK